MLDEIRERLPEPFDMDDVRSRVAELSPYIMVAIQVGCHGQNLTSHPSQPLQNCQSLAQ